MYVSQLGFFRKKAVIDTQSLAASLNLLILNIKNNTLRRIFCAYIQQELYFLTRLSLLNQVKTKRKRARAKLKFTLNKIQTKKNLSLRMR